MQFIERKHYVCIKNELKTVGVTMEMKKMLSVKILKKK